MPAPCDDSSRVSWTHKMMNGGGVPSITTIRVVIVLSTWGIILSSIYACTTEMRHAAWLLLV
jgi:hypothetical protein